MPAAVIGGDIPLPQCVPKRLPVLNAPLRTRPQVDPPHPLPPTRGGCGWIRLGVWAMGYIAAPNPPPPEVAVGAARQRQLRQPHPLATSSATCRLVHYHVLRVLRATCYYLLRATCCVLRAKLPTTRTHIHIHTHVCCVLCILPRGRNTSCQQRKKQQNLVRLRRAGFLQHAPSTSGCLLASPAAATSQQPVLVRHIDICAS
jgi:hypothetical protein